MATKTKKEVAPAHEAHEQTQVMQAKPRTRLKLKSYFKPTPKRFRVLGDSLAAASLFVAGLNLDHPKIMLIAGVCGALGKFITNFFTDAEN